MDVKVYQIKVNVEFTALQKSSQPWFLSFLISLHQTFLYIFNVVLRNNSPGLMDMMLWISHELSS